MLAAFFSVALSLFSMPTASAVQYPIVKRCAGAIQGLGPRGRTHGFLKKMRAIWAPAEFTGEPARVMALDGDGVFREIDFGASPPFFTMLKSFVIEALDAFYQRSLDPQLYQAWKRAEGETDKSYSHNFFVLREMGGSYQISFHLRIFEAVIDGSRYVLLPFEHLSRSLGTGELGDLPQIRYALNQAFRSAARTSRRPSEETFELGQYLVDAESDFERETLKKIGAAFLARFVAAGRQAANFVVVPGSRAHRRLYRRDFGFEARGNSPVIWLEGRQVLRGLERLLVGSPREIDVTKGGFDAED